MKSKIRYFILAMIIIVCGIQMPTDSVFAADEQAAGFTTKGFFVDVEISEDYVFHFKETIMVDFEEERHGLYRYIPQNKELYKIENVEVEEWPFCLNTEDDYTIKIGNADVLIRGEQDYTLYYDIVGLKDKNPNGDSLNLDVLPTDWQTPIEEIHIVVHFPKAFDLDEFKMFFGAYGANGDNGKIQYAFSDDGLTCTITGSNLSKGQGITIAADLPEGYWLMTNRLNWLMYTTLALFFIGIVLSAYFWYRYGRDEEVIKTVEFYPPNQMTPAEIGYVVKGYADHEMITSMILYFADKGYLSIHENGTSQFELTKERDLEKEAPIYAKILFNGLFKGSNIVKINDLPDGIARLFEKAEEQLDKIFQEESKLLFTKKSTDAMVLLGLYHTVILVVPCLLAMFYGVSPYDFSFLFLCFLGGSAFYGLGCFTDIFDSWVVSSSSKRLGNICLTIVALGVNYWFNFNVFYTNFHSIIFCVAFAIMSVTMAVLISFMQSRTASSRKWLGQTLGFRDFIEHAELDKLKLLTNQNPNYYFYMLPYAYVLGLTDQWTTHFMNQISVDPPKWYSGNVANTAELFCFNHLASRCMNSINENLSAKFYSEKEAGLGAGGSGLFSGGGFGGGGGGAW